MTKTGCALLFACWMAGGVLGVIALANFTGWPWGPIIPVASIVILGGTAIHGIFLSARHVGSTRDAYENCERQLRSQIDHLGIEHAEREARRLLSDSAKFQVIRSAMKDTPSLSRFAPGLRTFCADFDSIDGPFSYSRSAIGDSTFVPDFIRIADPYGDGHTEYVAKPGDETIYFVDSESELPIAPAAHAKSVWHCVLLHTELISD